MPMQCYAEPLQQHQSERFGSRAVGNGKAGKQELPSRFAMVSQKSWYFRKS
jgi:hypothetical protein